MNTGLFKTPPKSLCLVRLSALGDVIHSLPVVNTIRAHWPGIRITWIIGKTEYQIVRRIPGIEFIVLDKRPGLESFRELSRRLSGRRFDLLLLMQLSLRANLMSWFVKARIRLGFDAARSKELHGLFVNRRIPATPGQHVLESFLSFTETLGMKARLVWDCCYSAEDAAFARKVLPRDRKTLLISPSSSHPLRNWTAEAYAEIADYAVVRHGMHVVLSGADTTRERSFARAILKRIHCDADDLTGKTDVPQLIALLAQVDAVVSPDSGPAHIADSAGTPVIGLYAATNPARAAPYLSRQWCVNCYPEAARKYLGKDHRDISWGTKIEKPGVMTLIRVRDVKEKIDALAELL